MYYLLPAVEILWLHLAHVALLPYSGASESFMERRTVKYSAGLLECCRREGQKGRAVCLGERLEVPLVIDWKDGFQLLLL